MVCGAPSYLLPKKMALRARAESQYISGRRQLSYEDVALRCLVSSYLMTNLLVLILYKLGVDPLTLLRLQEVVGKAENLETVAITDDPEIEFDPFPVGGRNFDKARETSLLFDGSIDGR